MGRVSVTMKSELSKRDWILSLWEEVKHDDAARALLFGEIIKDIKYQMEGAVRNEVVKDLREKIEQEIMDNSPEGLLETARQSLIDDMPENLESRLKDQLRESIRDEYEDEIATLNEKIDNLDDEIERLQTARKRLR